MRELLAFAIALAVIVVIGLVIVERKNNGCPSLTIREYSEGR